MKYLRIFSIIEMVVFIFLLGSLYEMRHIQSYINAAVHDSDMRIIDGLFGQKKLCETSDATVRVIFTNEKGEFIFDCTALETAYHSK